MNKRQRKKIAKKRYQQRPWAAVRPTNQHEDLCSLFVATRADDAWRSELVGEIIGIEAAVAVARRLVDDYLDNAARGDGAEALYERYTRSGPDPYVEYGRTQYLGGIPVGFDAWKYARERCAVLCQDPVPSHFESVAALKGRYDEYDRCRIGAHGLMGRRVRLTRECSGGIGNFPKGAEGSIGIHACYIGASSFDWKVELPVVLEVSDSRGEVTFGMPYEALEFV